MYPSEVFQSILYQHNICMDLIIILSNYLVTLIDTNNIIANAVYLWCTNRKKSLLLYGNISLWNVSQITDMSHLFSCSADFNENISLWDVSNVKNMEYMFNHAHGFNQPLDSWNVSAVTNMECMFYDATSFNQPLDSWNVSNVKNMKYMFYFASTFNQTLYSWNVSKDIDVMFIFDNSLMLFNKPKPFDKKL